jgi:hypothetical protein
VRLRKSPISPVMVARSPKRPKKPKENWMGYQCFGILGDRLEHNQRGGHQVSTPMKHDRSGRFFGFFVSFGLFELRGGRLSVQHKRRGFGQF